MEHDSEPLMSLAEAVRKLNQQQLKFAKLQPLSKSNTQAAIDANYAEGSASTQAAHLMRNPAVKAVIAHESKKLTARMDTKADDVLRRLANRAMTDATDLLIQDPLIAGGWRFKSPNELSDAEKSLVRSFKMKTYERTRKCADTGDVITEPVVLFEYVVHDGIKATDSLARTFGLFRDVTEVHNTVDGKVQALFEYISEAQHRAVSSTVGMVERKLKDVTPILIEHGEDVDSNLQVGQIRPVSQ